jgi:hypothetical protein
MVATPSARTAATRQTMNPRGLPVGDRMDDVPF